MHQDEQDDALDLETLTLNSLATATRLLNAAEACVGKEPARAVALATIAQSWTSVAQTCVSMLGATDVDVDDD